MNYHRNAGPGLAILLLLCLLFNAFVLAAHFHMKIVFFVVVSSIAVIVLAVVVISKWYKQQQDAAYKAAEARRPCKHGVSGGIADPTKCAACQAEAAAAEAAAKEKKEEDKRAAEAARQEAYRKWLARIRIPEYVKTMDPRDFEMLVCKLFTRMGYRVEPTPYVGDSGVDGYLYKDGQKAVLQCKRVKGSVGEPVLRDLFGTMHASDSSSAVVVTTGRVSRQAREWAAGKPVRLIELQELQSLLKKHFHEAEVVPADYQPANSNCPNCGAPLRRIHGRGGNWLRCTHFPSCRFTQQLGRPDGNA